MDKTSPVFENFENKMAAMSGRPKINRNTFKIGSPGLMERVANNEKKITTLKNIFKAQKVQIGEKLTPKVNVLEESLIRTNAIITDVATQLEKDFSDRLDAQKKLLEEERKNKLDDKRESKESRIETKKISGFLGSAANQITKPFKSIFDKILDFGKLFLAGVGVNAAFTWLSNPENLTKMLDFLQKIKDRPLISLLAFGTGAYVIAEVIGRIIGGFRKVIFTLLNPMTYVDLFSGRTFKNFIPKMQKLIQRAGRNTVKGKLLKEVAEIGIKKGGPKILGALPLIGNFIDIGSAIYRFSKGDVVGGFLSLGSAIPVLGWGVAAIDIAREFGAFEGSILEKQQVDSEKADGGDFVAGERMLVGERGPEIVQFDRSGTVIPNHVLNNMRITKKPRITNIELPTEVIDNRRMMTQTQTMPGDSSTVATIVDYPAFNVNDPLPKEFLSNAGLGDLA